MNFILFFGILIVSNSQECTTTIKGIFSKQIYEFERSINQLRNEVAQARQQNHMGLFEYAANMQIITWSIGLSRGAQNCAERCPDSLNTCKNLKGDFGILFHQRMVDSSGVEWNPQDIVKKWMQNQQNAEQLMIATISQFGCGRAIKKSVDKYMEYVVCFFDQAPIDGKAAYIVANEKSIAKACRFGRSNQYSGLCASSYNKMLIMNPEHSSRIFESQHKQQKQ
ncbi:unnamed protein product [Paramecium primaurelia]|uniref:SCP domain-containing protein n=1 Tax=Paramecium primaurelia TaxID=5886 RepID=A0A8S1KSA8_PARPR|nr:unnamed protein product [Paramecium primaurelia]